MIVSPTVGGRFQALEPSATVEMSERVRGAQAEGRDIIAMSSGDPSLDTDPRIIEAAERALRGGATHYTSSYGEKNLREAIARREFERSGVSYDPADILVTPGGKFALLSALMSIIEPGNEVLIPQPAWVSYAPCVRLGGGNAVPVPMLDRFDSAVFREAITSSTRAIIVNSPVNPTGRVLTQDEIEQLVEMASLHDLWIIFDQVYTDLIHDGPPTFPQAMPDGYARTLVVDSLSKSFGMTGWRLGFLAMPPGIVRFVVKFIQHSIYCVPPFVQAAGTRALELASELLPRYRGMFRARVLEATAALSLVPGVSVRAPEAGFFLFPAVDGDDVAISRKWLDDLGIAVLPGSAFGAAGAGHLRISLTCSESDLDIALDRISRLGAC
jgi:aspartate aminotransferase